MKGKPKEGKTTHKDLVELARTWLQKTLNCGVVLCEISTRSTRECPDAIGFKAYGHYSVVVECKTSRSDFAHDFKKSVRADNTGMGDYRYYLCPQDLIGIEEVPFHWGLLYTDGQRVWTVKRATKILNTLVAERRLLYACLRRLFLEGQKLSHYADEYSRIFKQERTSQ